jgi:hypothetical protein
MTNGQYYQGFTHYFIHLLIFLYLFDYTFGILATEEPKFLQENFY